MRSRKVMKWLAAAAVGAMMMLPMTASAAYNGVEQYVREATDNPSVETAGISLAAENGEVVVRWSNALTKINDEYKYGVTTYKEEQKRIYIEYSVDPQFPADSVKTGSETAYSSNEMVLDDLRPGTTYYVRARMYMSSRTENVTWYNSWEELPKDEDGESDWTDYAYDESGVRRYCIATPVGTPISGYGAWSGTQTITAPVPTVNIEERNVSGNKVSFNFSAGYGESIVSGYEIQRTTGTSNTFKTIAKISDNVYEDKGLLEDQTYVYRVRAYAQGLNGEWTYCNVMTWGKNLNLKAEPSKKNQIKLKWNKISGVSGYEIYRYEGGSDGKYNKGVYTGFSNYKLIKTINKAKTVKYTDKKLLPGNTYSYMVVAFKNVKGKKVRDIMSSDSDTATLDFKWTVNYEDRYENADGSVTIKWDKLIGASRFVVEKYATDDATGVSGWTQVDTRPGSATSYTFPVASKAGESDQYRMYAVSGSKKSNVMSVSTYNNSVERNTANVSVSPTNGGTAVMVNWSAVPGAEYYYVYRSQRKATLEMNENHEYQLSNRGAYVSPRDMEIVQIADPEYPNTSTSTIKNTYVIDQFVPAPQEGMSTINEGPQLGVTYYYYVKAYIKGANDGDYSTTTWISAPTSSSRITLSATSASLKQPKISSVKSKKKGQAVVTWKAVKGAKSYYVYCSTKKKAKSFMCVGKTNKKSMTIKGLDSQKTYYFKVVPAVTNEANADVLAKKASKVKSVKVR